ncbi:uncharacterized protein LOC144327568 [Podarcis muralis]
MAPKKVSTPKEASARLATSTKRPIRGPSQALRTSAPRQPVGRVQSLVASMAGDPEALSRFAADMDGFLQQCSSRPSTSARLPHPVGSSSPASSASSENGREGLSAGGVGVDSQLTQPHCLPAARGRSRRPHRASGRATRGKTPVAASTRRAVLTQPSDEVASGSGTSLLVSPHSAPGTSQLSPDSESSIEGSRPVPARESSGGKRRSSRSSLKRAKQRRGDSSSSHAAPSTSRQDPDSGSSIEDSLPVPSRRSSGGNRRRKRSSRRHAKRRRDDSSSSYTGPAPVRVWMVGHSIVHWAGVAARQVGVGPGLGLPPHVQLSWLSRRGMRWSELLPRIRSQLLREGPPSAIVIQLGENDLVAMDCFSLRAAIWTDLGTLRAMVPSTKLFWSQLLQRCVWRGSRCPVAIERARKRINFAAKRRIEELGGEVISHPAILFKMPSFFRDDGVHLSASGNEAWLGAVVAKLRSWLGL